MLSWEKFYAEVRAELFNCGVADRDVLIALAPLRSTGQLRHLDIPANQVMRLNRFADDLKMQALPTADRECVKAAVALWERRVNDLEQTGRALAVLTGWAFPTISIVALVHPALLPLALAPSTAAAVLATDAFYRGKLKDALISIKDRL